MTLCPPHPTLATLRQTGFVALSVLVLAGALSGCLGRTPSPTFYSLAALPPPTVADAELAVLVGPVTLPRYLDRPQIVTREAASRMQVAELHRWAGSLTADVQRVLALDLAHHLGTNRVAVYPRTKAFPIDYQVEVDIFRFDGRLDTEVVLDARFSVRSGDGGDPLRVERLRFADRVEPQTYAGLVASHEHALARFGLEVAAVLRDLARADPRWADDSRTDANEGSRDAAEEPREAP
jgi:uncharacterized lipoprotein YmbA